MLTSLLSQSPASASVDHTEFMKKTLETDENRRSHDSLSNSTSVMNDYDYSKSTTENHEFHGPGKPVFVGKYAGLRALMDYSYHKHYTTKRQYFHDRLIDKFTHTIAKEGDMVCEQVEVNWLVFTAGTMGVGKGYVLGWLNKESLFPLESFVLVDPDRLRDYLPENKEYINRNPYTAGYYTQKEVGYISEVLTLHGLKSGKNVLVDGSLRDAEWYIKYVQNLKVEFPALHVGIIYVTASLDTLLERVKHRGEVTGRQVPVDTITDTYNQVPRSVLALTPYADVIVTFDNDSSGIEPRLLNMTYPKHQHQLPYNASMTSISCPSYDPSHTEELTYEDNLYNYSHLYGKHMPSPPPPPPSSVIDPSCGMTRMMTHADDMGGIDRCLSVADLQEFYFSSNSPSTDYHPTPYSSYHHYPHVSPSIVPKSINLHRSTTNAHLTNIPQPSHYINDIQNDGLDNTQQCLSSSYKSQPSIHSWNPSSHLTQPPPLTHIKPPSENTSIIDLLQKCAKEPSYQLAVEDIPYIHTMNRVRSTSSMSNYNAQHIHKSTSLPRMDSFASDTTPTSTYSQQQHLQILSFTQTSPVVSINPRSRSGKSEEPWIRAWAKHADIRDDNIWWRDEFQALWEIRCAIPDYSYIKNRRNTDDGKNSIRLSQESVNLLEQDDDNVGKQIDLATGKYTATTSPTRKQIDDTHNSIPVASMSTRVGDSDQNTMIHGLDSSRRPEADNSHTNTSIEQDV